MKVRYLLLSALLLTTTTASAQTSSKPAPDDAPGVSVAEIRWRKEVFVPALYDDPMRINQEHAELERDQRATARENVERAKQGQTALPQPTKKIAANIPVGSTPMGVPLGDEPAGNRNLPAQEDPGVAKVHYLYEAKIKNSGAKTLRAIDWTYLLFDPETQTELGRRRFTSKVNVRTGKSANLVARSRTPLTQVVHAKSSSKREKHDERVVIERIEYDDGSVWQRSSN